MTAAECIGAIEQVLIDHTRAEEAVSARRGRLDANKAAELRVEALREIEIAIQEYQVYGERK